MAQASTNIRLSVIILLICISGFTRLTGQVLEAENAILSGDILIQDDQDASNGAFVYLRNSGEISWQDVFVPEAGQYSINIRHRLLIHERVQTLVVNGVEWGSILFDGDSNIWLDHVISIDLNAGSNTITILGDWGWQHFDYITQPLQSGIPFASFVYTPSQPNPGEEIQFDAGASSDDGELVDYSWNFGDQGTASGLIVTHSFTDYGSYSVTLTVADNDGNTSFTTQVLQLLPTSQSIRINELMADNAVTISSENDEFPDWIELLNIGNSAANLGGWYLSDDPDNPFKWEIPVNTILQADEFLLIWADGLSTGLHTSFKLDREGETIVLSDPDGSLVDSVSYPSLLTDVSHGRNPGYMDQWVFYSNPTPGSQNGSVYYQGICPQPLCNISGGFHSGNQNLQLASELDGVQIRYTLDGTPPVESSELYTDAILLEETTPVRMRVYKTGFLPSPTLTQTYFINEPVNLPVISLVTDPDNFFDDQIGIYVIGTNGVSGYCSSIPMNVNQDWERPVNIELFETDGTVGLNQQAGVKIFGGCSRTRYPQKSLGFYARGIYGEGSFDYQLFPHKPIESFETFILRTSADDQVTTLFRDALAQSVVAEIDIDGQAYRPVVVYINGEYWGIHNMREKLNEHYPAGNYNLDSETVDILKRDPHYNGNIISGSADHYLNMLDYLDGHSMADPGSYNYIGTQMNVNEFINYQITEIYLATDDWPGNNIKYWRSDTEPYTTWRWMMYDMDWTFTYPDKNELALATEIDCGCSWPNPPWSTYLFRKLLENAEFTAEFLQRHSLYVNTIFQPDRLIHFIDSLQAQIAPEIPRHIERWGGQLVPDPESWISPTFASVEEWESNVEVMRTFAGSRAPYANQHLLEYFGLPGMAELTMNLADPETGILKILGREVEDGFSGEFFRDVPVRVTIQPNAGFQFDHWQISGMLSTSSELIPAGSLWAYSDTGDNLGSSWSGIGYDDSGWPTGPAELGYGDGDETTVVGYGPDANNKYVTTYFRHSFPVEDPDSYHELTARIVRDDGAVLYLNGVEFARSNMDQGPVYYDTWASDYVSGQDESAWYIYPADPGLLVPGDNILAVEIHQANAGSSDISFNLILSGTSLSEGEQETSPDQELSLTLSGDLELTAVFTGEPVPTGQLIVFNEINYNSAPEYDTEDWVELINISGYPLDLSGWEFRDSEDAHVFEFRGSEIIQPDDYIVLCRDTTAFRSYHPDMDEVIGNFSFGLSGGGELIRLYDGTGQLQDNVTYSDSAPWPAEADGNGATLELVNPLLNGDLPENWRASTGYGTPGAVNSQLLPAASGDFNQDGAVDILDAIILIAIVLDTDIPAEFQLLIGDIIADGVLDILDLVALVAIILSS